MLVLAVFGCLLLIPCYTAAFVIGAGVVPLIRQRVIGRSVPVQAGINVLLSLAFALGWYFLVTVVIGFGLTWLTDEVQRANLLRLHAAGVPIVAGTDLGPGLVLVELKRWEEMGLERQTILQRAFGTGPALFPTRKIGCLEAGCEADFLILDTDPLRSLDAPSAIRARSKAGELVSIPSAD